METIIAVFWLFLPAGIGNMSPVIFKRVPVLAYPISEKLLGKNKTWRGMVSGVFMGILTVSLQKIFTPEFYSGINPLILGALLGGGALIGDLIESFFKRKIGIAPGKPWIPFDQIDWIAGAILFSLLYVEMSIAEMLIAIVIFGLLHPLVNFAGYLFKVREVPL